MSVDFPKRKTRRMSQSIDLASGHPSPALIPIQHIQKAANHALSNPAIWQQGTNYGPDAGYIPLRQNLSRWLASFYASDRGKTENPDVERICVTGGASQNLANILQVYTDPVQTRRIFVVEPAYFLSFRIFEDAGFGGRLKGVPEDKEGVDLKALEDALKQEVQMPLHEGKSPKVCVFESSRRRTKHLTHHLAVTCIQTTKALQKTVHSCDLLCTNILQPIRQNNEPFSTPGTCPSRPKVRRPLDCRRCLRLCLLEIKSQCFCRCVFTTFTSVFVALHLFFCFCFFIHLRLAC